ncbi:MAG: hypothetical protein IJF14_03480 [Clostridia bacterium]|nr:hypothetical protein [Clostridia bacterium]
MRNELNCVLKDYLRARLQGIKLEKCYTQWNIAQILHMERRTVAGLLRGEHSMNGLTVVLYLIYLAEDPVLEIENMAKLFQDVLQGSDYEGVS